MNDSQRTPDVIPIFFPSITDEEIAAAVEVLRSGWIGSGQQVNQLEKAFALSTGARYAISTNNGTSALMAAMWGLGAGPGQQVIVPSFTYIAIFQALRILGCEPVFADIEPNFLTLDPNDVADRITSNTAGIVVVHHGGQLADMARLRAIANDAGVWLIEDCAHAAGACYQGAPAGSLSDAACFSFNAVKNLTAGDGGMVTLSDPELAHRVGTYRSLGIDRDTWKRYGTGPDNEDNRWCYDISGPGIRAHMNDITAAIAGVQLRRLEHLNASRARLVARYEQAFAGLNDIRTIKARPDTHPAWHMYTVLMNNRGEFVNELRARQITVGVHYHPIHLYDVAAPYRVPLPVTEELWRDVTTFPLFPTMNEEQQDRVVEATIETLAKRRA